MTEPTISKSFQDLIPPLTDQEYSQLETNIRADGCRDPLVVWREKGVLLDGHNRLKICKKYGIKYQTTTVPIKDEISAIEWIILNQFGKRNLEPFQRAELALRLKPVIAARAKEKQKEHGDTAPGKTLKQKSAEVNTRLELAKLSGLSHDTIAKAEIISEQAAEEIKSALRMGAKGMSINKVHADLMRDRRKSEYRERVAHHQRKSAVDVLPTLILCDPPWKYDFQESHSREIENHYETETIEELKKHCPKTDKNCICFMWATAPKLLEAITLLQEWGFTYRTHAIWDKKKIGTGYWFRGQHELLLVGVKGTASPPQQEDRVSSIFQESRTTHSTKPDCVYIWMEKAFPMASKMEMYCRKTRNGWQAWGDEV